MTMIERVARAIAQSGGDNSVAFHDKFSSPDDKLINSCIDADTERALRQARAAIEAMYEPTPEIEAIAHRFETCSGVWNTMIDAALSEPAN